MTINTTTFSKGTVVIISKDSALCQTLKSWLHPFSLNVINFESPMDWRASSDRHRKDFVGVWIELKGMLGLSEDVKSWLTSIEDTFPVVKIIAQKEDRDFSANISGEIIKGREDILKTFSGAIRYFEPRGIRSSPRVQIYHRLRVQLKDSNSWINCNSFNLSSSGAMLTNFGENIPYKKDQMLLVEFVDFTEVGSFEALVMWTLPWEAAVTKLPGIGLMFKNTSPERLEPLLKYHPHR